MGEREPDLGPLRHGLCGSQEPIFSGPKGGTCVPSHFSHVRFFVTSWTVARQAPLSMGFSRQEYWSRWPFPPPGDLPYQGIKPMSLISPSLAGVFFTTSTTYKAQRRHRSYQT